MFVFVLINCIVLFKIVINNIIYNNMLNIIYKIYYV